MTRAAIYTRVSTAAQLARSDFTSTEAQAEALRAYAATKGWEIVGEWTDAISGSTTRRPGLQRLLAAARRREVDVILVYKHDRLSRSVLDFFRLLEDLARVDVGLVAISQDIDTTTPVGRLMQGIMIQFAAFEREQIAERTRDKIHASRARGRWTGGNVPLGYDVDREAMRLIPNEAEAPVVRRLFESYAAGDSVRGLARRLNEDGHRTKRRGTIGGKRFTAQAVASMLASHVYIGSPDRDGSHGHDAHEPLVDGATWERVQARLEARRNNRGGDVTGDPSYVLKGLLRCGCGAAMTPQRATGAGGTYRYYRCTDSVHGRRRCLSVSAEAIETLVVGFLKDLIRGDTVRRLIEEATAEEEASGRCRELDAAIGEARERVARLERTFEAKERRADDAVGSDPSYVRSLTLAASEAFTAAEAAREALRGLESARRLIAQDPESIRLVAEVVPRFAELYDDMEPIDRAETLRLILDRAVVDAATSTVTCHLYHLDSSRDSIRANPDTLRIEEFQWEKGREPRDLAQGSQHRQGWLPNADGGRTFATVALSLRFHKVTRGKGGRTVFVPVSARAEKPRHGQ